MAPYWNFRQILNIHPEKYETCVGITKEHGKRCKNTISEDDDAAAVQKLNSMDQTKDYARALDSLELLARLLLCKGVHNKVNRPYLSQVEEVCRKWHALADAEYAFVIEERELEKVARQKAREKLARMREGAAQLKAELETESLDMIHSVGARSVYVPVLAITNSTELQVRHEPMSITTEAFRSTQVSANILPASASNTARSAAVSARNSTKSEASDDPLIDVARALEIPGTALPSAVTTPLASSVPIPFDSLAVPRNEPTNRIPKYVDAPPAEGPLPASPMRTEKKAVFTNATSLSGYRNKQLAFSLAGLEEGTFKFGTSEPRCTAPAGPSRRMPLAQKSTSTHNRLARRMESAMSHLTAEKPDLPPLIDSDISLHLPPRPETRSDPVGDHATPSSITENVQYKDKDSIRATVVDQDVPQPGIVLEMSRALSPEELFPFSTTEPPMDDTELEEDASIHHDLLIQDKISERPVTPTLIRPASFGSALVTPESTRYKTYLPARQQYGLITPPETPDKAGQATNLGISEARIEDYFNESVIPTTPTRRMPRKPLAVNAYTPIIVAGDCAVGDLEDGPLGEDEMSDIVGADCFSRLGRLGTKTTGQVRMLKAKWFRSRRA